MQSIKAILPVFILWIITGGTVHAQSWQWAVSGGSMNNEGSGIPCMDDEGNIYCTGQYSSAKFVIGGNSINAHGGSDIYLTKIDPTGKVLWIKGITSEDYPSGSSGDFPCDIQYNRISKTILVCGAMNGSNCKVVNCDAGGGEFTFIARFDTDGNCIWVRTVIRNGGIQLADVEESDDGFIYLTASTTTNCIINNKGFSAGSFLAKYRANDGNCVWAKKIGTCSIGNVRYFNNNLYTGGMSMLKDFTLDGMTVHGNINDFFLSNFDTGGNIIWAKTFGGPGFDIGGWVTIDPDGNLYTTGTFTDTAWFDNLKLITPYKTDWYLLKTDRLGNVLWVQQGNISGQTKSHGLISVDNNGLINVVGRFSGTGQFGKVIIEAKSSWDMFLTRYSSSGICEDIVQIPQVYPRDVICDQENDIIIAGNFYNSISFGQTVLKSLGGRDVAFAKFSWKPGTGEPGNPESENTITIFANPTTGLCTVKVPEALLSEGQCTYQLTDMHGKIVETAVVDLESGKVQIDLQQKAKGVYHVLLRGKDQVYKGKIVFY